MLQKEFESLTGQTVTSDMYEKYIDPMYMRCGDMDKHAFCALYKKHGENELVRCLMRTIDNLQVALRNRDGELNESMKEKEDIFDTLMECVKSGDMDMVKAYIIARMGYRWYLLVLLAKGMDLEPADRRKIYEMLKGGE